MPPAGKKTTHLLAFPKDVALCGQIHPKVRAPRQPLTCERCRLIKQGLRLLLE
jgi:hypothetical protein